MVAIQDEVNVPQLVGGDGGQAGQTICRHLYVGPAAAVGIAQGQEGAREILIAAHAADDGVQRNLLAHLPAGPAGSEILARIFEGEQIC